MDINTITEVVRQPSEQPGSDWRDGDAWLAGGTWLFSDQQPDLRRLIDLDAARLGHPGRQRRRPRDRRDVHHPRPVRVRGARPTGARPRCSPTSCEAFLASFKVWNSATVGGNICMSLPAGPMITMTVALEATYTLWRRTAPNAPSTQPISSPATTRTSSRRVRCCAASTSRSAPCASGTRTAASP